MAASYEANLNHDDSTLKETTDELVEVYTGNTGGGDSGFVLFTSGEANDPYSIEARTARAGWTSIYLIDTEVNDYLFELYNAKTILEQIQESMAYLHQSEMLKKKGIDNGYPAIPYFAPSDDVVIDATGTSLDYADEGIVVFHDYYGLFVYDINEQAITGAIALEPIGCNYTQGDNYCEVMVDNEGTTIYLHPLQEKEMYVYDIATCVLTQQKYNMDGIEVFDNFDIKEDIVDWDPTVFQTRNIVQISEENWIHLESGSGWIQRSIFKRF